MSVFFQSKLLLNPFGGSDSSASTTSVNTSATGSGQANDAANAVQSAPGSIAVGAAGTYNESGATDLSGVNGNVSINDPAELTQLADDFAATTQNIASGAAQSNLASNNAFLQGLQQLAMSQQTGGLTPVMKTFLWLALGGLALLAIVFRKRGN